MTAMPQRNDRTPDEEAQVFIAEYQNDYSAAMDRARAAAETTQTPAWIANYAAQLTVHKEASAESLAAIKSACEFIRTSDTNEDEEKVIRDAVKSLSEERIRFMAWRNRAVGPYMQAATDCQNIKGKAQRDADDAEKRSPLVTRGLSSRVAAILKTWPDVTWNDKQGVVEVSE